MKYFNKSGERIFVQTNAVIGRKVQLCHPQESIHIVNRILEGFKTGKRMTCHKSVATNLKNAGAIYEDKSVVVDGKFVTSRFPAELPDFCLEASKVLGKSERKRLAKIS